MVRFLCVLLLASGVSAADTIPLQIRRIVPKEVRDKMSFPQSEERRIPIETIGCEGKARLRAISYTLEVKPEGQTIYVHVRAQAELEKLAKGPMAAPSLRIESDKPLTGVFEGAMMDAKWEEGGTFTESFSSDAMLDGKFWKSLTLRCAAGSPYRPVMVPEGVVYKNADDAVVAAAVAKLDAALRGMQGLGTASLYDLETTIIGPDLYAGIKDDAALEKVESPRVTTIDPNTKKARAMLRIKGAAEAAAFGVAMRRYLGDAKPRIRAATSAELARYWLNIGWDIEEPLLIADYGTHRLVFSFANGVVMMVDEIPPNPT